MWGSRQKKKKISRDFGTNERQNGRRKESAAFETLGLQDEKKKDVSVMIPISGLNMHNASFSLDQAIWTLHLAFRIYLIRKI